MIANRIEMPPRLFVTGTDTDVGKTVVSASLAVGSDARYWKPVQAGTEPLTDTERVMKWTGRDHSCFYAERHCLERPMSPHAAAELEGVAIDLEDFQLPGHAADRLIVEGAGGVLVPLNRRHTILDLILQLNLPVLLVARSGLGTINHTLMSLQVLRQAGAEVWGVVLNGPVHRSNEDAVGFFGQIKHLYRFPPLDRITPHTLQAAYSKNFIDHAS